MATTRSATTTWHGTLFEGSGRVELESSGLGGFDVTWPSRAEEPDGRTSPEELIAAAHSSCFSMALSNGLAKAGNPAETLETKADVTFQPGEGITGIHLTVTRHGPRHVVRRLRRGRRGRQDRLPGQPGAHRHHHHPHRRRSREPLTAVAVRSRRRGEDGVEHVVGAVERRARSTRSSAVWARVASPGPRLHAGTPSAAKRATSVQPSLAVTVRSCRSMSAAQDRVVETGRGRRRAVDDRDLVAVLEDGREERPHLVGRFGLGAVGGEAPVERDGGEVGDDVAGHATRHHHRLERLAVLAALDDGPALVEALDQAQQLTEAVDGVATHPRPGGVGPLPAQA